VDFDDLPLPFTGSFYRRTAKNYIKIFGRVFADFVEKLNGHSVVNMTLPVAQTHGSGIIERRHIHGEEGIPLERSSRGGYQAVR